DRFYRATEGPQGVIVFPFEDSLHYLQGKRLSEIAGARHREPIETMFDLIIADHARSGAIYFLMSEADVRAAKLMPLEFAVRKMTSLAAQRVGLTDRGLLKPGMFADITVFNPATVID